MFRDVPAEQRIVDGGQSTRLALDAERRAHMGEPLEGIRQMQQCVDMAAALGLRYLIPNVYCHLAQAHGLVGQVSEGLQAITQGLATAEEMGGAAQYWIEMHRVRGELLLQLPAGGECEAEAEFLTAISLARRLEGKSLELRAAISLGRLWQRQGKRQEARDLVQGVYAWFSEGFDLPDLVEARALLADLDTDCTDQHQ